MDPYIVYMHISPSGKRYIGITCQVPERRWRPSGQGYDDSPVFYNAIKKYGWDNFKHEIILSNLTYEEAEKAEIFYIEKYRSSDRKYGYNMESGGTSGKHLSEETKEKLRKANTGRKHSEETIEKMRQRMINNKYSVGKKHNTEWKQKMSQKNSGSGNPFYGRHHSAAVRQAQSARARGNHYNSKSIFQYNLDGTFVAEWMSATHAASNIGIKDKSNICACARGTKKSAYGYLWKYKGGDLHEQ